MIHVLRKLNIEAIEKKKEQSGFSLKDHQRICKIINIDITGKNAAAKVQISKKDNIIYTDYLLLLKYRDGWKIVAKIYHEHK